MILLPEPSILPKDTWCVSFLSLGTFFVVGFEGKPNGKPQFWGTQKTPIQANRLAFFQGTLSWYANVTWRSNAIRFQSDFETKFRGPECCTEGNLREGKGLQVPMFPVARWREAECEKDLQKCSLHTLSCFRKLWRCLAFILPPLLHSTYLGP